MNFKDTIYCTLCQKSLCRVVRKGIYYKIHLSFLKISAQRNVLGINLEQSEVVLGKGHNAHLAYHAHSPLPALVFLAKFPVCTLSSDSKQTTSICPQLRSAMIAQFLSNYIPLLLFHAEI